MASLEDLLQLVKREDYSPWGNKFQRSLPGWENLVRDPANWSAIENTRPVQDFYSLCKLLLKTAGVGLAVRWYTSSVSEQAKEARLWLSDVDNLNADIWSGLTEQMKEDVIYLNFDSNPGEPFRIYRDLAKAIWHISLDKPRPGRLPVEIVSPFLPVVGYVPSSTISKLRSIVERACDSKSLQVIDNMNAQREKACQRAASQQPLTQRIPYTLTRDER